jgi:hypothetical protein
MSFYEELKAFPVNTEWDYGGEQGYKTAGMNMRDYFAAKAMPIIIKDWYDDDMPCGDDDNALFIAKLAYKMADAMMEARNEPI